MCAGFAPLFEGWALEGRAAHLASVAAPLVVLLNELLRRLERCSAQPTIAPKPELGYTTRPATARALGSGLWRDASQGIGKF